MVFPQVASQTGSDPVHAPQLPGFAEFSRFVAQASPRDLSASPTNLGKKLLNGNINNSSRVKLLQQWLG
jgi:N-acyl-L-homoserine lactone synthetase